MDKKDLPKNGNTIAHTMIDSFFHHPRIKGHDNPPKVEAQSMMETLWLYQINKIVGSN